MPGIVKLLSSHKAFFFRKLKIFLIIETQPPEPLFYSGGFLFTVLCRLFWSVKNHRRYRSTGWIHFPGR